MDKENMIYEHSEEKLSVYREYLDSYLSVLTNQGHFTTINIIDLFAGSGISENKKKGSAMVAVEVMSKHREKGTVNFYLNEKDTEKYKALKKNLSQYDFPVITNKSADDYVKQLFIDGCLSPYNIRESRSLLFIDPYGYTQLSIVNLAKLLQQPGVEVLIFVPVSSIYRFKDAEGNPARRFVLNLGFKKSVLKSIKDMDSFVNQLTDIFKAKADTEFCYGYDLRNKNATNSLFYMFFITKNIRGAEKFLEAKDKIKNNLKNQLTLFDVNESKRKADLQEMLINEKTNIELHAAIIKMGCLAKEINPILRKMEDSGSLKIQVDFKRKTGAYYLNNADKTIHLKYQS